MSSSADSAAAGANRAAKSDRELRMLTDEKLKRDKIRNQNLFIRQLRAQQAGGIFSQMPGDTLG